MGKGRRLVRILILTLTFSIVCVVYLGKLFSVQLAGKGLYGDSGITSRLVTVQAMRGEIYDRNGKPLVTNSYFYDLNLSYTAFSRLSVFKANDTLLLLLGALDACGKSGAHTESYFPFAGEYPYYTLTDEAKDPDSVIGYRLRRILKENGLQESLPEEKIRQYYVDTYQFLVRDKSGKRLFRDDEIDRLFRLRYDMDAMRFGAYSDYTLAKNVGLELITYVREMKGTECVSFTVTAERNYHYPGIASHILGTVGKIWSEEWEYYNELGYQMNAIVGKTGCEYAFESDLHGVDGQLKITENAVGEVLSVEVVKEPVAGRNVYLTLDIDLQIAAEEGLAETVRYVQEFGEGQTASSFCDAGAAVVMDPETFEVLAIASYPTYDLSTYNLDYNDLVANPASPLLNRALQGVYTPGSTVKPGVAVAGLEEGEISPTTLLTCTGSYQNPELPGDHPGCSTFDQHSAPAIDVREAISDSCNSFFYELGYRLGMDRLEAYLQRFGFGEPTGIELGEKTGTLAGENYRHASYRLGEVIRAAIGQSDTQATPLQLCSYFSTLYNGGTRRGAHLKDRVSVFGSGELLWSDTENVEVLDRVEMTEAIQQTVLSGMRDMIGSTAFVRSRLTGLGLDDAVGKTGTAQVGADGEITNALFICGAAYGGEKIALSVVTEKAAHGYYNAIAAEKILSAWKTTLEKETGA